MAKKKKARKKKKVTKKTAARGGKKAAAKKAKKVRKRVRGKAATITIERPTPKGMGPGAAGQSGDIEGLSETEFADSESVAELAEEGQDYEAEIVSGVENAPEPDQGEVRTHEVPEDDVPPEYRDQG
ncbi:MAG TPA: hypothetical protein VEG64_11450 [Candidatus Sulfotelmatobacter sp.]|nr:hypothetical protein [Candidatus Sulfotelmatobacter sp.]